MNATELKQLCKTLNQLPVVWSARAQNLTDRLTADDVCFEESGTDADWHVNIVLDGNAGASVRYDGGLKVSLQ
jgi:hypothetical protein